MCLSAFAYLSDLHPHPYSYPYPHPYPGLHRCRYLWPHPPTIPIPIPRPQRRLQRPRSQLSSWAMSAWPSWHATARAALRWPAERLLVPSSTPQASSNSVWYPPHYQPHGRVRGDFAEVHEAALCRHLCQWSIFSAFSLQKATGTKKKLLSRCTIKRERKACRTGQRQCGDWVTFEQHQSQVAHICTVIRYWSLL